MGTISKFSPLGCSKFSTAPPAHRRNSGKLSEGVSQRGGEKDGRLSYLSSKKTGKDLARETSPISIKNETGPREGIGRIGKGEGLGSEGILRPRSFRSSPGRGYSLERSL